MNQSRFPAVRLLHAKDDIAATDAARRSSEQSLVGASSGLVSTTSSQTEHANRSVSVLTHTWIWSAIDLLAARHGLTPSALARRAGLDPTTFNPSKRTMPDGKPRWPNTASLSKILEATGTTLDEFASLHAVQPATTSASANAAETSTEDPRAAPILGDIRGSEVERWSHDDDATLETSAPAPSQPFGLTVADDSLEPVFSRGSTLIVSTASTARSGDKVIVKQLAQRPKARLLVRRSDHQVVISTLDRPRQIDELDTREIDWIGRVVWVRQVP